MEFDACGLEHKCFQEMETNLIFLVSLQKIGPKVNQMDNYSSEEDNFLKLYQQLKRMSRLIVNGKI